MDSASAFPFALDIIQQAFLIIKTFALMGIRFPIFMQSEIQLDFQRLSNYVPLIVTNCPTEQGGLVDFSWHNIPKRGK
jgi:hypothetical protein